MVNKKATLEKEAATQEKDESKAVASTSSPSASKSNKGKTYKISDQITRIDR